MEGEYKELHKEAAKLAKAEYLFYLQCAKHKYFKEVDRNTTFFHSLVKEITKRGKL